MKKLLLGLSLGISLAGISYAQQTVFANSNIQADSQTTVAKNGNRVPLQAGTLLSGELQSAIDVKKAHVGDQVVLKTTKAIKQNGRVIVDKDARLIGKVTDVQQKTKTDLASHVNIIFNSLQQGNNIVPIEATIVSVFQSQTHAATAGNNADSDLFGNSSVSTQKQGSNGGSNGGGLLGGVTQTVGSVANTATQTVGGVANSTGGLANTATGAVGNTLRGIQITSDVSAQNNSMLSLQGDNLRLEKGTTFNLRVLSSTERQK